MTVAEAWEALGVDPREVFARIRARPRVERAEAAERELVNAKKAARSLLGRLHPDRPGGDAGRFREVGEAVEVLARETEKFKLRIAESISVQESARARKDKHAVLIKIRSS